MQKRGFNPIWINPFFMRLQFGKANSIAVVKKYSKKRKAVAENWRSTIVPFMNTRFVGDYSQCSKRSLRPTLSDSN